MGKATSGFIAGIWANLHTLEFMRESDHLGTQNLNPTSLPYSKSQKESVEGKGISQPRRRQPVN